MPLTLSRRRLLSLVAGVPLAAAVHPARGQGGANAPLIAFAQDDMANDWRAAQVAEVARTLADLAPDIRFVHTDAGGDTARQVLDIDTLVARGANVLITSPRDAAILTPAIARAHRAGVHVVLLTRRILGTDYSVFISPDDAAIAGQAGRVLAGALGGRGRILILQGLPTATTTTARTNGFLAALEPFSGLEVVATLPANFLRADAIRAVEQAVLEGIAFDAIYAQSDSMAVGARLALRAAGIDPASVPMVGIDYIPAARQAIRDGLQLASFTYPTCGAEGAMAAVALLRGRSVTRDQTVPSVMVTRDNVDAVAPIFP